MRALLVLLLLCFSLPAAAQSDKVEKKSMGAKKAPTKVAPAKADKKVSPAKAGAQKSAAKKQEPSQDWGRFQSQSKKDEKERAEKAAKK